MSNAETFPSLRLHSGQALDELLCSLNHTDALTANRALTHLGSLGLLRHSEQRRGPGVYYTLVKERETPQITSGVTPDTVSQLLSLLRSNYPGIVIPSDRKERSSLP